MRLFHYLLLATLKTFLLLNLHIYGHGFGAKTMIKLYDKTLGCCESVNDSLSIEQIYSNSLCDNIWVKSCDLQNRHWEIQSIKRVGSSETNCYMRIKFDLSNVNVIECTPSQRFYEVNLQCWLPACQLWPGYQLLRDNADFNGASIEIVDIELVAQQLPVYMIEVANYHTFLVTDLAILTHNIALESTALYVSETVLTNNLGFVFTSAALGPWGVAGNFLVGSLIVVGATYASGDLNRVWYKLKYDIRQVARAVGRVKDYFMSKPSPQKEVSSKQSIQGSGGGSSPDDDPEDDDKNIYYKFGKKQLLKAQKSFQELISEHEQKLTEYKRNPSHCDNKNLLNDSAKPYHSDIIEGRIVSLIKQIAKQKRELVKINKALGLLNGN